MYYCVIFQSKRMSAWFSALNPRLAYIYTMLYTVFICTIHSSVYLASMLGHLLMSRGTPTCGRWIYSTIIYMYVYYVIIIKNIQFYEYRFTSNHRYYQLYTVHVIHLQSSFIVIQKSCGFTLPMRNEKGLGTAI
jgi:hypothetical protein